MGVLLKKLDETKLGTFQVLYFLTVSLRNLPTTKRQKQQRLTNAKCRILASCCERAELDVSLQGLSCSSAVVLALHFSMCGSARHLSPVLVAAVAVRFPIYPLL